VDGSYLSLDPALVRIDYLENISSFLTELKRICAENGCDYHPLPTDRPLGEGLAWYLQRRSARLKQT